MMVRSWRASNLSQKISVLRELEVLEAQMRAGCRAQEVQEEKSAKAGLLWEVTPVVLVGDDGVANDLSRGRSDGFDAGVETALRATCAGAVRVCLEGGQSAHTGDLVSHSLGTFIESRLL